MDSPVPRDDPLAVSATYSNGAVWIVVRGEVDLANRDQLRAGLSAVDLGRRPTKVYLDLSLLGFCDSAGCRILLRYQNQVRAAGHEVRIHRARPIVRKVMVIVGEATVP